MNNRRAIAIFFLSLFFLIPIASVKAASCVCVTDDECTSISADMSTCDTVCIGSGYESSSWTDIECTTSGSSTSSTSSETSTTSRIWNLITGKSSDNYTTPILSINIPTVSFSKTISEGGYLKSNFIGDYVSGFYKYLLAISGIIAVLLFMVGGLQYVISPGGEEVGAAKKRITGALTGMVLLFCVYLILYTVNPKLTSFDTLKIQYITPIELSFYQENLAGCPDIANTVKPCSSQTFVNPGGNWSDELVSLVNQYGTSYKVDPILLATHLQKETSGSSSYGRRRGPCGEIGPAQFMPTTFEQILGKDCCTNISRKRGLTNKDISTCTNSTSTWPPTFSFTCRADICSNCQEAATSCIDYFDTSKAGGLKNTIEAQTKLVRNTLMYSKVGGDLALEMCAYNGSGKAAAEYAKSAAQIYSDFCKSSGGTQ